MIAAEGRTADAVQFAPATMLAAAITASGPADAWLVYPDRDDPARVIVEIERPYGDVVPFANLPPPFNVMHSGDGPASLLFRWPYEREAIGSAFLDVGEDGQGAIEFEFVARKLIDGQRLGAAAVLVAKDGTPLHTFYARADTLGGVFDDGTKFHRVRPCRSSASRNGGATSTRSCSST